MSTLLIDNLINVDYNQYIDRGGIMEEKKCNCGPDCTCGCQEGKECTCTDKECNCDETCECGCHDKESKCTCNDK